MEKLKGYELIESDFVDAFFNLKDGGPFGVVIYSWLLFELRKFPELNRDDIELEFLIANYANKYPCIGLHYKREVIPEFSELLYEKMEFVINHTTFLELHQFVKENAETINQNLIIFEKYEYLNNQ